MKTLSIFISIVICLGKCLAYKDRNALHLLDVLKKYGATKKPPELADNTKQFVAVTVLTEEEFEQLPMLTKSTLLSFLEQRVKVQYNVKKPKRSVIHGEKIILDDHLDGLVNETKTDCKSEGIKKCSVFMFSWYIPCSMKSHTCAMKIKEKSKSYQFYIGFSEIYVDYQNNRVYTINNVENSFKTLDDKNIVVYYLLNYYNGIFLMDNMFSQPITKFSKIFQSNMFDCIIQTPISFCCGSDYDETNPTVTNLSQVDRVTAFAINTMIYYCKSFFNENNDHLNISSKDCFLRWSEANMDTPMKSSQCKVCWDYAKSYKGIVNSCILHAFMSSEYIGMPNDSTMPENNVWERKKPEESLNKILNKPKTLELYCNKRKSNTVLHPGTFCTRTNVATPSPPKDKCKIQTLTKRQGDT